MSGGTSAMSSRSIFSTNQRTSHRSGATCYYHPTFVVSSSKLPIAHALPNVLAVITGPTSRFSISVKFIEGYASRRDSQGNAPSVWGLLDKQLVRIGEGLELRSVRGFNLSRSYSTRWPLKHLSWPQPYLRRVGWE